MRDWFEWAWKDSVWSKVIAALILAVAGSAWAALKFQWLGRLKAYLHPKSISLARQRSRDRKGAVAQTRTIPATRKCGY